MKANKPETAVYDLFCILCGGFVHSYSAYVHSLNNLNDGAYLTRRKRMKKGRPFLAIMTLRTGD